MGTPAFEAVLPRDPLPPVRIGRPLAVSPIQAMNERVRLGMEEVAEMLRWRRVPPGWLVGRGNQQARLAVASILRAGCSPVGYVDYVIDRMRRKGQNIATAARLLGGRAVAAWLPEYKRHAAGQEGRATYEASPARRAQYAKAMRFDLLPAPRADR